VRSAETLSVIACQQGGGLEGGSKCYGAPNVAGSSLSCMDLDWDEPDESPALGIVLGCFIANRNSPGKNNQKLANTHERVQILEATARDK